MRWKFWSSPKSIADQTPSIAAIFETVAAVTLYWYYAIHFENYTPLIVSTLIAPLVLLRSEKSIALGVKWFRTFEEIRVDRGRRVLIGEGSLHGLFQDIAAFTIAASSFMIFFDFFVFILVPDSWISVVILIIAGLMFHAAVSVEVNDPDGRLLSSVLISLTLPFSIIWWIATKWPGSISGAIVYSIPAIFCLGALIIPLGLGVFFVAFLIRCSATARHIVDGIKALPNNFRRLVLCTSPSELPELVPGLGKTDSSFTLERELSRYRFLIEKGPIEQRVVWVIGAPLILLILFLPAWLFRFSIKSTVWFWWPIVYLGSAPQKWREPELFHWRNRYGLAAWASYFASAFSIASFLTTNLMLTPNFFDGNPLLVIFGYFFLADWHIYPWQALSLCLAILSFIILFWADDLGAQHKFAKNAGQLRSIRRKFVFLELLSRTRLTVWVIYIVIVGIQVGLYFNSKQCLIRPPAKLQRWGENTFGKRTPPLCLSYKLGEI